MMTLPQKRALAAELATIRNSTPRKSTETFSEKDAWVTNYRGALGEIEVAELYGLEVDRALRPYGDGGIDFTVTINGHRVTIDVKTFCNPGNMTVKEKNIGRCADILILCRYDKELDQVFLKAWETSNIMAWMKVGPLPGDIEKGYNSPVYQRPFNQLRPIRQLTELMNQRTYEQANHG